MLRRGRLTDLPKEFGQKLIDNTREVIGKPLMYKDGASHLVFLFSSLILFFFEVTFPTAPHTEVTEKGNSEIKYSKVLRENVRKLEAYVKERGDVHCQGFARNQLGQEEPY